MDKVICRKIPDGDEGIKRFLDEIFANGWLDPGSKQIVIKPNLCTLASVESGIITDISFVRALVRFIKSKSPSSQIKIIESDSFDRTAEEVFEKLGYCDLAREEGVDLINLTKMRSIPIAISEIPYEINLSFIFLEDIFYISIANLKTHDYQKVTCGFKNQFGCIPDVLKERYHPYLDEVLYYLDGLINPDLSIVDGRIALEGNGPVDGEPIKCDLMIAGNRSLSVDTVCARVAGFDPVRVPYLRYAYSKTKYNHSNIQVAGDKLDFNFKFIPDKLFNGIRLKIFVTRTSNVITNYAKKVLFHLYYYGFIATARIVPKSVMKKIRKT